jgi:uncharacterized protein YjbI with pentapeptide repeats
MANQEQLSILKQGVEIWNKWRSENKETKIDLSGADLSGFDLQNAFLLGANLNGASFHKARLFVANLCDTDLSDVDLSHAFLKGAKLLDANLVNANLNDADLQAANFSRADLRTVTLRNANLTETDLTNVTLYGADLRKALLYKTEFNLTNVDQTDFTNCLLGAAVFARIDLSLVIGLEMIKHHTVSTLGTDTLLFSKGKIPEAFLRGCGLSDWEIESAKLYNPDLSNEEINKVLYRMYDIRATQALQISPLFISYSHADSEFVDRIEKSLNSRGIRFWRDIHHATAGKLEKQIDRAIRHNPTVLVILSENSVESDWVEHEGNLARKLEKETKRDVLCPIALDNSLENSPWSEITMEQVKKYNILDFSEWEDDEQFEKMFVRLIDGLNLFYKKEEE